MRCSASERHASRSTRPGTSPQRGSFVFGTNNLLAILPLVRTDFEQEKVRARNVLSTALTVLYCTYSMHHVRDRAGTMHEKGVRGTGVKAITNNDERSRQRTTATYVYTNERYFTTKKARKKKGTSK